MVTLGDVERAIAARDPQLGELIVRYLAQADPEDGRDAALFGVLAYRFDAMRATPYAAGELGAGTLLYLRRRAWRYLRMLGQAVPDAYPAFVVEVLRHYPASYGPHAPSWVAAQIWGHGALGGARGSAAFAAPSHGDPMQLRTFPQAWKLSLAPLLRLLEAALNDIVCDWAIRCLRADHPLALRAVEPAWLARLGRRPVAAIHAFVVSLLRDSPELHQSKLRELGLHDVVLGFLRSPSAEARGYALEYAATHAPDLAVDELVELIEQGAPEVARFAAARLEAARRKRSACGCCCGSSGSRRRRGQRASSRRASRPASSTRRCSSIPRRAAPGRSTCCSSSGATSRR